MTDKLRGALAACARFAKREAVFIAALLLAGLPVEASAASGHLTVTPDTLVSDLRADPTFAASGVWTWQSAVDSPDTPEAGTTLSDYVGANMAQDSADVWAAPGQFQLDETGHPTHVAGVPPDAFSATAFSKFL